MLKRKAFFCVFLVLIFSYCVAQKKNPYPFLLGQKEKIVLQKNYPLLSYWLENKTYLQKISIENNLSAIANSKWNALSEKDNDTAIYTHWKFSADEISIISKWIGENGSNDALLQKLPNLRYGRNPQLTATEVIQEEWMSEANGINWTISVYGEGKKPHYPNIDSISEQLSRNKSGFKKLLATQFREEIQDSALFFSIPLKTALSLLELNGRMEAADYEPMALTENKLAIEKIKSVNWAQYPYTHIMIPGAGPAFYADSINPENILRCKLAAILYKKGLAPFIITSGGRVHPYKTLFSEAFEMKKYLVNELHIPASAIIIEPHARHTTTNIRNTVRLLHQYHIPTDKKGVISSTEGQLSWIREGSFAKRCQIEMGEVPYRLGNSISSTATEYFPLLDALLITPTEPLDP